MTNRIAIISFCSGLLACGVAQAAPLTFSGQDDGAPITGPFPASAAAEAAFLASATAYGPVFTTGYERLPVSDSNVYSLGYGVTVTLNALSFGNGYSGISDITLGNLYGFNTTPGGSHWLGFPVGSATFTFATTNYSFGTYLTGLQTQYTTDLTYSFDDGTPQLLSLPVNENGGAQYFGVTDSDGFTSLTITNTSNDAWGIDDTSFNISAVPLPAGAPLFGMALVALGMVSYRLKRKSVSVV